MRVFVNISDSTSMQNLQDRVRKMRRRKNDPVFELVIFDIHGDDEEVPRFKSVEAVTSEIHKILKGLRPEVEVKAIVNGTVTAPMMKVLESFKTRLAFQGSKFVLDYGRLRGCDFARETGLIQQVI